MEETNVFDGQGFNSFQTLEKTVYDLDEAGRTVKAWHSNGTLSESVWGCCNKEYESVENPDIHSGNQIRIGAEYLMTNPPLHQYVVPVRCGFFYDPAPANSVTDEFYGMSFGTGISIRQYVFDIAYQFRFGNDTGNHIFQKEKSFSQDVNEHIVYTSFIYHFNE